HEATRPLIQSAPRLVDQTILEANEEKGSLPSQLRRRTFELRNNRLAADNCGFYLLGLDQAFDCVPTMGLDQVDLALQQWKSGGHDVAEDVSGACFWVGDAHRRPLSQELLHLLEELHIMP